LLRSGPAITHASAGTQELEVLKYSLPSSHQSLFDIQDKQEDEAVMSGTTRIRDRWIPIGLEAQFPASSAHPVVANGEPLVVWRDETGYLHVWEDRCPHRGMRLSFGFVRGETLTCLYHGWRYGGDGGCKHIPAHPDLKPPETICATTYASTTSRGLVFTASEGTETMAAKAGDKSWYPVRSIYLAMPEEIVRDHVMTRPTGLADTAFVSEAGLLIAEAGNGDEMALAIQPVEDEKTGLHLSTTVADPEARLMLAKKLLRLRNDLEHL
jgi:nitrite reductase/ring-hydroxylating ferredoxin subunit